jgi:hypothetical protein
MAAGYAHTVGLRQDGTIVCWGLNDSGQCNSPSGTFTKVTAAYRHSGGLRTDGTIAVWGGLSPVVPPGAFVDIGSGELWMVGQRPDGTLESWGDHAFIAGPPPAGSFKSVAVGKIPFAICLRHDGTLLYWGFASPTLAAVPSGSFVAVSAGSNFAIAIRADGSVAAWGTNNVNGPLNVPPGLFSSITASYEWGAAVRLCYANCDDSTVAPMLTANDFQCFLNRFAAQDPKANCDGSTGAPQLTANDFQCFLNKYATGCS